MKTIWVVTANSNLAHVYLLRLNSQQNPPLNFLKKLTHAESRKKTQDLVSDGLGRYKTRAFTRGTFAAPQDPKEVEMDIFAQQIAKLLEQGRTAHEYDELVLVALPHFYGLLEKHLNKHVKGSIRNAIQKDYVTLSEPRLQKMLREKIKFPNRSVSGVAA